MDRAKMTGILQTKKREDYLKWPDYFMAIAFLSAQRSKDPRTQVGACIVNQEKKIVGIGYNGMPNGCNDDVMPWGNGSSDVLEQKYLYVCHAELNAVLNKNSSDAKDCTMYVALFPCNECAKIIIQSGITEVVYYSDKYADQPKFIASKRMFDHATVKYHQYQPKCKKIVIDFDSIDRIQKSSTLNVPSMEPTPRCNGDKEPTPQCNGDKEPTPRCNGDKEPTPRCNGDKEPTPWCNGDEHCDKTECTHGNQVNGQ